MLIRIHISSYYLLSFALNIFGLVIYTEYDNFAEGHNMYSTLSRD